jgi:hypothetical protein
MNRLIQLAIMALLAATVGAAEPQQNQAVRRFVIEVTAVTPGVEQAFRAAVGYSGRLEFIEGTTPFRKEFDPGSRGSLTAMFEATNADGVVKATLYGAQNRSFELFGSVTGRSGKLTDEPWNSFVARSSGPF